MEDVKYVSRNCVVCGKAFSEVKHPKGNKRKFCSHECEIKHRREYRREYFRKRYGEDAEYRKRIKENNFKYGTEKRRADRKQFIMSIAESLATISDVSAIEEILEENFRPKNEKYDKHARTLRLSKESSD